MSEPKLSEHVEAIWQELWPYIASEDPPDSGDSERDLETVTSGVLPRVWNQVLAIEAKLSKMEEALKFIAFTGTDCPAGYERDSFYRGQLHGAIAAAAKAVAAEEEA